MSHTSLQTQSSSNSKITYAKVIGVVALGLVMVFGISGIVQLVGFIKENSNEGVALFKLNETNKDPQIIYDEEGKSMKILIEQNCIDSLFRECIYVKDKLTELKELIKEKGFTGCPIVKWAENNCEQTNDLDLSGYSFSFDDQYSTTDNTKLAFWFQRYFNVTEENYEAVKNSIHLKRFTCIKKKSAWRDGICIRNLMLVLREHDDVLNFEGVKSYFAKNFQQYTKLPKKIAELIDYNNLDGTQIYYKNGKKVYYHPNEEVYVLPSKPTLTKEAISWMKHDYDMSQAICNSLGLRKLTKKEIKALPTIDPNVHCLYDDNGKEIYEKKSNVWAFGRGVGTNENYIEVMDNERLMIASKKMDVIYVNTTLVTEIPNDWIKIHEHVFLEKSGSRKVETPNIECNEFEENREFKEFTETDYVMLQCKGKPKINLPIIDNYYNYSMKEQLPATF